MVQNNNDKKLLAMFSRLDDVFLYKTKDKNNNSNELTGWLTDCHRQTNELQTGSTMMPWLWLSTPPLRENVQQVNVEIDDTKNG